MSRNHYGYRNGHGQAQALMGAWHQIVGAQAANQLAVGWQNSGYPTNLQHGVYGGHRSVGYRPNFQGYGYPADGDYGQQAAAPDWQPYQGPPPGYSPGFDPGYGQGYQVPPRNMMVDYPQASRADRVILPMSSGVNILPNTSAQITARPQNVAFRPERMIIGGSAGNWIVNDIKVGNQSQLSQSGDLPGEMFAATTIDSFVSFATVQTAMDFVVLVTNVGTSESGEPFVCGVLGTAAV